MSRRHIVLAGLAAVAALGATRHAPSTISAPNPLEGGWELINPGMRGQSFIAGGHYVVFSTRSAAGATDSATVYTVDAGAYSEADGIVTSKRTYANDARLVGQTYRWTYTLNGDTLTYHIIDAASREIESGRGVRLRPGR